MRQSGTWVLKLRVVATGSTFPDVDENGQERIKTTRWLPKKSPWNTNKSLNFKTGTGFMITVLRDVARRSRIKKSGKYYLLREISGPGQPRGYRAVWHFAAIRHFLSVRNNVFHQLYHSLIYPFLIYGLLIWGNTYNSTLKTSIVLKRRAICIMTFFGEY